MSEKLKPCPFCGSRDIDDEPVLCMVYCTNCDAQINSTEVDWNTRPIEDALRKRIAELEADNNRLKCSNDTQTDSVVYGKDSD